jgi:hypothetical protein
MTARSETLPLVILLVVYLLAFALHCLYVEFAGTTVVQFFTRHVELRAGEMLWRITEMAIPIAAALAIVWLLCRYFSLELASPLRAGYVPYFRVTPTIYCTSESIASLNGGRTGLYKNTFFLQVKNDLRPAMTLKSAQVRLFHLGRPVLARIRDASCGSVDLPPGESMLVEVGAVVSFHACGSRGGDQTMPEHMARMYFRDVSNGRVSFDVEDFLGKRRYGLVPQEPKNSVRELLLAISADEVRSFYLVVSIDTSDPNSPIKCIKPVALKSAGWSVELRELRQAKPRSIASITMSVPCTLSKS